MLGLITQARARDLLSWLCICHRQQGRISRIHCSGVKLLFAGVRKFEKSGGQRAAFVMKSCRENPRSVRIEFHRSSAAAGGQCKARDLQGLRGAFILLNFSIGCWQMPNFMRFSCCVQGPLTPSFVFLGGISLFGRWKVKKRHVFDPKLN